MPKWQPEAMLKEYKVSLEDANILLEELAEIFYDYFASLENLKKTGSAESKPKEDDDFFKRTGSDG